MSRCPKPPIASPSIRLALRQDRCERSRLEDAAVRRPAEGEPLDTIAPLRADKRPILCKNGELASVVQDASTTINYSSVSRSARLAHQYEAAAPITVDTNGAVLEMRTRGEDGGVGYDSGAKQQGSGDMPARRTSKFSAISDCDTRSAI